MASDGLWLPVVLYIALTLLGQVVDFLKKCFVGFFKLDFPAFHHDFGRLHGLRQVVFGERFPVSPRETGDESSSI